MARQFIYLHNLESYMIWDASKNSKFHLEGPGIYWQANIIN